MKFGLKLTEFCCEVCISLNPLWICLPADLQIVSVLYMYILFLVKS